MDKPGFLKLRKIRRKKEILMKPTRNRGLFLGLQKFVFSRLNQMDFLYFLKFWNGVLMWELNTCNWILILHFNSKPSLKTEWICNIKSQCCTFNVYWKNLKKKQVSQISVICAESITNVCMYAEGTSDVSWHHLHVVHVTNISHADNSRLTA